MAIIGIDLGTTNSTLSYVLEDPEKPKIEKLAIPQLTALDTIEEKYVLPSFYYFPLNEEKIPPCVGQFAKERGSELPERVIVSAKSWLCHHLIDRRTAFLPFEGKEKISPQAVCTAFLKHLKEAWEKKFPDLPFISQKVVVTTPASFDPSARQLVQEACVAAGFPETILMEEPLASFYGWLYAHEASWRKELKIGDTILVVDIGGGTTDFSLIEVTSHGGDLSLERKAVGDHLLLGGDNIDLTLAFFAQNKLGEELDFLAFQKWVSGARQAKEILLGENPPLYFDIHLQGRGSKLIGGSKSIRLEKEEVETLLLEGFFPTLSLETEVREEKEGLKERALAFAKDPRITAHLAQFLRNSKRALPTAVLFNGGTMKCASFQKKILSLLTEWKQDEVLSLKKADLDFAVSMGACYYGWTRQSKKIRVKAGASRSYFIGVEKAQLAVPGMAPTVRAHCIVPMGMEEGSETVLKNQKFSLLLDESAHFRFFSSNREVAVGEILSLKELSELKPIETLLKSSDQKEKYAYVELKAKFTELGVLELWCESEMGQKWKLEFDIRKEA